MDFLDPRRRRAHRRRLKIGYALMSILVAFGTLVVMYLAYGYDIDRKTGNLIQNGIVFVDSKPGNAKVFVNNVQQSGDTDMRLALPAGVYTIRIEANGFRHWERTFNLEGGEIRRLIYPILIPNQFITTDIATFDAMPSLAMQSPDRRWVLVQRPAQTYQFDVFDLSSPEKAPESIIIPPGILTDPSASAVLQMVEWSNDNRHVLLKRVFGDKTEWIVFDREDPGESFNLNTDLGISPVEVSLRDKKFDQFYYLESKPGILRNANADNKTISAPLIDKVIDYRTYGDHTILYVTKDKVPTGRAEFRIRDDGKTYTLKQASESDHYVLDLSRFDDKWFYVAGSSKDDIVSVYENPVDSLKSDSDEPLLVTALMRLKNPRFVSFSANTQFIGLQSGDSLLVIDLEDAHQYRTNLDQDIALDQKLRWMDGHRFIYTINSQSYIVDFDGSNKNTLVTSRMKYGPFFDRDYDNVFTFEDSKSDFTKKAFTRTIIDD